MIEFLQLLVAGIGVGALYALLALGFVVVYKSTHVLNFAQGSLLLLGTYLTFQFGRTWIANFYLAVLLGAVACAAIGVVVQRLLLSRMVGESVFSVIMVTIGLAVVLDPVAPWLWGTDRHPLRDPWGLETVDVGGVVISVLNIVRIVVAGVLLAAFFLFFRRSRLGIVMRATATDQEAALAMGISARVVHGIAWGLAGATGTVAGVLLSAGARGIDPTMSAVALGAALPAIVIGGLDSPEGAVIGGIVIGIVSTITAGYGHALFPEWLGTNFHAIVPYILLVVVLLVRPYGLFGTKEVERL